MREITHRDTAIPLTDRQLDDLARLMASLTQGEYQWGRSAPKTRLGAILWSARAILSSRGARLHMVLVDTARELLIVAMTGNGPNAHRNAEALANLLEAWPYLLAELRRHRSDASPIGSRGWRHG